MEIKWLGHSCFKITHSGYSVVIDPYETRELSGYPELHLEADAVLCSHEHHGHNNRAAVKLTEAGKPCPYELSVIDTFHDTSWGKLRGPNRIHILDWDGYKLVHMGDFGCILTDNEKAELFGADVLMINAGGFRAMPSDKTKPLADELFANVVIPMHYAHDGCGNRRLERVEAFTDQYMPLSIVRFYDTDTIEITRQTPTQVAVLKFAK